MQRRLEAGVESSRRWSDHTSVLVVSHVFLSRQVMSVTKWEKLNSAKRSAMPEKGSFSKSELMLLHISDMTFREVPYHQKAEKWKTKLQSSHHMRKPQRSHSSKLSITRNKWEPEVVSWVSLVLPSWGCVTVGHKGGCSSQYLINKRL